MKISGILIILIAFACCSSPEIIENQNDLSKFNSVLGEDYTKAFDKLVESQSAFLEKNYPNSVSSKARAKDFLLDWESLFDPSRLTFLTKENLPLINELEITGLRKELFEYYETWIFIDDSLGERYETELINNLTGKYIEALKTTNGDSLVSDYLDAVFAAGDLNPPIVASGLLENGFDYDNPIHQRIMAAEIYFKLIKWDLERKRHANIK